MKFFNAIRAGHFLNLRRQRDARTVNHFEKIGARILNVRAAGRENAENNRREKMRALHRLISRCWRRNYKQLFTARDKVAPLII